MSDLLENDNIYSVGSKLFRHYLSVVNRKRFLRAAAALAGGFSLLPSGAEAFVPVANKAGVPPFLKEGDTIGITSPAGAISHEGIQPAVALLGSWGFKVKVGNTIGRKDFTLGGTDEERAADFEAMLRDDEVKAILCARGGYGSLRIVDAIDWNLLKKHPKWVIGFSDITVLHCHIHQHCGLASVHSKMTNSFPDDWSAADGVQIETILSIRDLITGRAGSYTAPPHQRNRVGESEGLLVGGNLKTIETLGGSVSDLSTRGKLLFVEDTGEYLYSIDRMFWNLKRSGKLDALAGLIVGGFKIKPDDPGEEFGRSLQDIVLEKTKAYNYPVCFDFPVGHQKSNYALAFGGRYQLKVTAEETRLIPKL